MYGAFSEKNTTAIDSVSTVRHNKSLTGDIVKLTMLLLGKELNKYYCFLSMKVVSF